MHVTIEFKNLLLMELLSKAGESKTNLKTPRDIASDQYGYYYVADHDWGRIRKLNSDGNFVDSWGFGLGTFPISIAINRDLERVYVSENGNSRIVVYDYDGNFLFSWGSYGQENGQFIFQTGIAIDNLGYVYVLDQSKQSFSKI
jgi:DNA-binding beta-propeller fold protein YncE